MYLRLGGQASIVANSNLFFSVLSVNQWHKSDECRVYNRPDEAQM